VTGALREWFAERERSIVDGVIENGYRLAAAALVLAVTAGLAGCGGDDDTASGGDSVPETGSDVTDTDAGAESGDTAGATDAPGTGSASTAPDQSSAAAASLDDVCALVGDAEVAAVFGDDVPQPESASYGAGFAECSWEHADDSRLLVSVMPAAAFQSDFVDQLNRGEVVESDVLGPDAASFVGVAGIGTASGGGASVGFTAGDIGVVVAVRVGEGDAVTDLPIGVQIAETVAGRL
jgi:hypothetical protein